MSSTVTAAAPQHQASDPSRSVWVSANAGSGKTHALVNRVIMLMLEGAEPSRILCLTFTKAAAAEMSLRLFERLGGWISLGDADLKAALHAAGAGTVDAKSLNTARRLFTSALETPGGLKIQTIHAFCERLLHLFPVEAGIVPGFSVMDGRTANEYLAAARNTALRAAQSDHDGGLSQALSEAGALATTSQLNTLLQDALAKRGDLAPWSRDEDSLGDAIAHLRDALKLHPADDETSIGTELAISSDGWRRLVSLLAGGSKPDMERAAHISAVLEAGGNLGDLRQLLLTEKDDFRSISGIASKKLRVAHGWVEPFIVSQQEHLCRILAKLSDLKQLKATRSLLTIFGRIQTEYELLKQQAGLCDYDDLILLTSALLRARSDAAWVLYKLDGGLDHILIDEAQDTSPSQWDIVGSLIAEFFSGQGSRPSTDRTLFVVGDRKQSIFSFQGADANNFEAVHGQFGQLVMNSGQVFSDLDFTVSYRSTPEVLWAVDSVFEDGRLARRGLDGSAPKPLVHQTARLGEHGVVEIWPLVEADVADRGDPWVAPVAVASLNSPRRELACHIARKVHSWIGRRRIEALRRAVMPSDILILVRRRNDLFDALIQELRKLGVPVAGSDRLDLACSIAVQDLMALLRFCILPSDDYSLACVLKSPLVPVALGEDQLFELAWDRGPSSLWERLRASSHPACVSAGSCLAQWIEEARSARPYEFVTGVLLRCRKAILGRLGSEADDALDALLDQCLEFERSHTASLSGFIHWFSVGGVEIKRSMEQSLGEVRIMTVHGAKGLEAPIIILPDTTDVPDRRQMSNFMMVHGRGMDDLPFWRLTEEIKSDQVSVWMTAADEAQAHEYQRLLYVAMTRARDELYICGCRSKREEPSHCWYTMVKEALLPGMTEIGAGEGWRFGGEPVWHEHAPLEDIPDSKSPPDWVTTKLSPTQALRPPSAIAAARVARGTLLHRVLRYLPDIKAELREAAARNAVVRAGFGDDVTDEIVRLFADPEIGRYLGPGAMTEVPVMYASHERGPVLGRIDRLIVTGTGILLVDYKSDDPWAENAENVRPEYLTQLGNYRAALEQIYPGKPVEAAILWTAAPLFMPIPARSISLPALD